MDIQVGDILTMKKQHPCGEKRWEVLRIGADFKLRCLGCGREVMGPRAKFEKMVRQIYRKEGYKTGGHVLRFFFICASPGKTVPRCRVRRASR